MESTGWMVSTDLSTSEARLALLEEGFWANGDQTMLLTPLSQDGSMENMVKLSRMIPQGNISWSLYAYRGRIQVSGLFLGGWWTLGRKCQQQSRGNLWRKRLIPQEQQ